MTGEESTLHVHREHHEMLPVWFFIGILLLFYGLVILVTGIREYNHPPAVILTRYHASIWGGFLLTVIGTLFSVRFHPRRKQVGR